MATASARTNAVVAAATAAPETGRPHGENREGRSPDNENRKRPHRGKRPQGQPGEQAAGASARPASRPSWRRNKNRSAA